MPSSNQYSGRFAERLVAHTVRSWGWTIVGRNHRVHGIEIDLLARHARVIHVVEIKFRRDSISSQETWMSAAQQERLRRAAEILASTYDLDVSLDLACVHQAKRGLWSLTYNQALPFM